MACGDEVGVLDPLVHANDHCRRGQTPAAAEHRPRATPERQEADATLVQLVPVWGGGQLRIEDQSGSS